MAEKEIVRKSKTMFGTTGRMRLPFVVVLLAMLFFGMAFPYEPEFYLSGLFLFTLVPCLIIAVLALINLRMWWFYFVFFVVVFRMLIIMNSGYRLNLIQSIIGGLAVLLYINILSSIGELSRRFINLRAIVIKVLDFLLYAVVFAILALFIIVPLGRLNVLESQGLNDLWIFIIGFFMMASLILLLYILLSRRDR
jgi:hypothetical protein